MNPFLLKLLLAAFLLSACGIARPQATETAPTDDGRIISQEPEEFLLKPEDLPEEEQYYLPDPAYSNPFHNTDVVASWGGERGWDYLQKTGRVDGYWVDYLRGSEEGAAPDEMFCNVVKFGTAQGARLSLTDYNLVAIADPNGDEWSFVDRPALNLGDLNIVLSREELQDSGENWFFYRIEFSYRNYVGVVVGMGLKDGFQPEYVEDAARVVLAKLQSAPLSDP